MCDFSLQNDVEVLIQSAAGFTSIHPNSFVGGWLVDSRSRLLKAIDKVDQLF